MTIEYRNAPVDKTACFELFMSTGWNCVCELNEDQYFEAIRRSWHLVSAYDGEQMVGLGRVISDGQLYALIVDVIVLPEYRGQGIGTTIMEQMLEHCRFSGIRDVKLFAAKGKADLYRRFGFVERSAAAPGMELRSSYDATNSAFDAEAIDVVPTAVGYDRWAKVYDSEDNPLVLLEERHIGPLIGEGRGLAVADIGCGTGRHALPLAAAGVRVTAVDLSEVMLQRARAKPGADTVKFIRHDLAKPLPLESATFDRVLCCLVGDHIADLRSLFRELRRICRPDGRVVFSVMHPAMLLRGVQARFIDPDSGRRISPVSYSHQIADYVMAALRAGLTLDHLSEHAVDSALAARSPRGSRYVGWPLLLLMRLVPSREAVRSLDTTETATTGPMEAEM